MLGVGGVVYFSGGGDSLEQCFCGYDAVDIL